MNRLILYALIALERGVVWLILQKWADVQLLICDDKIQDFKFNYAWSEVCHGALSILNSEFCKLNALEWIEVWLTLSSKTNTVLVYCSDIKCVVVFFQMIFGLMNVVLSLILVQ